MRCPGPGATVSFVTFLTAGILCLSHFPSSAQPTCATTVECAQKAVEAATRAEAAAKAAQDRFDLRIDALERTFGGARILAMAYIRGHKLSHSSAGVSFNSANGVISFPNPKGLPFVPIISTVKVLHFATEMNYIREVGANTFRIWQTPLDTGDRNSPPADFTAVVIAFDKVP